MARVLAGGAALLLLAVVAAPVTAAVPDRGIDSFVTDPYGIAECDGFDVMEQTTVSARWVSYFDQNGNWVRDVRHASDTAVDWRTDSGEQVATYSDAGGTFTAKADGTFIFTGIHNAWTLRSGEVVRDVGRVVVAEVAPGEFERIFEAGQLPDTDPCTW